MARQLRDTARAGAVRKRRSFVGFLETHPDAFARSCVRPRHGSAAGGSRRRALLLRHHKKLGIWVQRAATPTATRTCSACAPRSRRGSGLRISNPSRRYLRRRTSTNPRAGAEPAHMPGTCAMRSGDGQRAIPRQRRIARPGWIDVPELETVTREESMLRLARKWRAGFPRAARGRD
jgi:hypothetical protein